jgi:hypothetical protein
MRLREVLTEVAGTGLKAGSTSYWTPEHRPHRREDGTKVDALWRMYQTRNGDIGYYIDTIYDVETGEILHASKSDHEDMPQDEDLKMEVLSSLRAIPPQSRFADMDITYTQFANKAGNPDVWISSIVDTKTGEVLHDDYLKGAQDPALKQKVRSYLRLNNQHDYEDDGR